MGQDIAEFEEFDETRQTKWSLLQYQEHKGINQLMKDLNFLYKEKPALYAKDTSWEGFEWINCISPEKCMLAYIRKADKPEDTLLVVANFAGIEQEFTVGVPYEGKYKELLNTDNKIYGGQGSRAARAQNVNEGEVDGRPYSVQIKMAPLSLVIYSYIPYTKKEKAEIEKRKAQDVANKRAADAEVLAQNARDEVTRAKEEVERAKDAVVAAERKVEEAKIKAAEAETFAAQELERAKKIAEELKQMEDTDGKKNHKKAEKNKKQG